MSQDADGAIRLDRVPKDVIAEIGEQPLRLRLVHFDGDSLISAEPIRGIHPVFAFIGRDEARPREVRPLRPCGRPSQKGNRMRPLRASRLLP